MAKIIVRIRGGLGNQLFCYAAARRLSIVNRAELVVDDVTGFIRDHRYVRKYSLDAFNIIARKATSKERMEPFERYRRGLAKLWARRHAFVDRSYVEQEGNQFDSRLLDFRVRGTVYLDGLWQSEAYFKDIEAIIREDFRISAPEDGENQEIAALISGTEAVAVHIRRFCSDGHPRGDTANLGTAYYMRAMAFMDSTLAHPHYFVFSDRPEQAAHLFKAVNHRVTSIMCNRGEGEAYKDLWLMSLCKHFVIANSTFSWWGAWLGNFPDKAIVAPSPKLSSVTAWGFPGQIPGKWLVL